MIGEADISGTKVSLGVLIALYYAQVQMSKETKRLQQKLYTYGGGKILLPPSSHPIIPIFLNIFH